MSREHASIIDVAHAAGVSPATVSRALRGLPHVSEETRLRVRRAAAELDYVASPAGTGLASGRTKTVGIVVPLASRWFFSQVLASAEAVLRRGGYDVLLYSLLDTDSKNRFFTRLPVRRKVDALLLVSFVLTPKEVEALLGLRVPVVMVGSGRGPFSRVRIDEAVATRRAADHLVGLGHDSVAMVSALEDDDLSFSTAHERRAGFRTALPRGVTFDHVVAGDWGVAGGMRAAESMLEDARLPTAVFAEYDEMAIGFICAFRRAGLQVPGDLSVVGFDDHEMSDAMRLTTVAQPVREQGDLAARLVLDHLSGGLDEPVDVVLETRLVERTTTGPPLQSVTVHGTHPERAEP
ncbi:MAG: LacI family DNA-binding transcriptional regulator [Nocardioides sp.]